MGEHFRPISDHQTVRCAASLSGTGDPSAGAGSNRISGQGASTDAMGAGGGGGNGYAGRVQKLTCCAKLRCARPQRSCPEPLSGNVPFPDLGADGVRFLALRHGRLTTRCRP